MCPFRCGVRRSGGQTAPILVLVSLKAAYPQLAGNPRADLLAEILPIVRPRPPAAGMTRDQRRDAPAAVPGPQRSDRRTVKAVRAFLELTARER
jgi:hypothetical protein